jgi:hypothetical protein
MDINQAIFYGQLVNAAYAIPPENVNNTAGQVITAGTVNYNVVTSIFANDLATDMNPLRGQSRVSIGLILQAAGAGDVVIAIRGTEGIQEWIHDAQFLLVPCPFLAGAGHTEDGFTAMYLSMTTGAAPGSPSVVKALSTLAFPRPVTSLTICSHSTWPPIHRSRTRSLTLMPARAPGARNLSQPITKSFPTRPESPAGSIWFPSCLCLPYTITSWDSTTSTPYNLSPLKYWLRPTWYACIF